jgi:hypothetical protein
MRVERGVAALAQEVPQLRAGVAIPVILTSSPGVATSPWSWAIPPKSHRVIPSTATPLRLATIAWASS